MNDERALLAAAVERLEVITARLADAGVPASDLKRLAEEALAASAEITERLPRVIREIERASEGASPDRDSEPPG